jgi:hypothetical protein
VSGNKMVKYVIDFLEEVGRKGSNRVGNYFFLSWTILFYARKAFWIFKMRALAYLCNFFLLKSSLFIVMSFFAHNRKIISPPRFLTSTQSFDMKIRENFPFFYTSVRRSEQNGCFVAPFENLVLVKKKRKKSGRKKCTYFFR